MSDRIFLDTNILIYLFSTEKRKQEIILKLMDSSDEFIISTQVISEFCNVLLKKFGFTSKTLEDIVKDFKVNFKIAETSITNDENALKIQERYRYGFYGSLILATAIDQNCDTVISEDLQHMQKISNKLKIINPF